MGLEPNLLKRTFCHYNYIGKILYAANELISSISNVAAVIFDLLQDR